MCACVCRSSPAGHAWSKAYGAREMRGQRGSRPPYSYRYSEAATTGRPFRWSSRAASIDQSSGCQDGGAPCRTWRCGHRTPWPRTQLAQAIMPCLSGRAWAHAPRTPIAIRTGVIYMTRAQVSPCSVFACHPAIPTLFLPAFSSLCSMRACNMWHS